MKDCWENSRIASTGEDQDREPSRIRPVALLRLRCGEHAFGLVEVDSVSMRQQHGELGVFDHVFRDAPENHFS